MKNFRKREIIIGPCNSSWNSNRNSKISKQTLLIEALSSLIKFLVNSFERKLDSVLNLCWMLTISHCILFFLLLIVGSNLRTRVVVIAIFNASTVTKLDICNLIARRRIFATITKNQAVLFLNADCWNQAKTACFLYHWRTKQFNDKSSFTRRNTTNDTRHTVINTARCYLFRFLCCTFIK